MRALKDLFRALGYVGLVSAAAISAGAAKQGTTSGQNNSSSSLSATSITAGIFLLLIGTQNLFFGNKYKRATFFTSGFMMASILILLFMCVVRPPRPNEQGRMLGYLWGSMIFGLCGGVAGVFSELGGLCLLGAMTGFHLGSYVNAWVPTDKFVSQWAQIVFIMLLMAVFALLSLYLKEKIVIPCSSIVGAYSLFVGIDCFASIGLLHQVVSVFSRNDQNNLQDISPVYGMLVGTLTASFIGMFIQSKRSKEEESN
ncbi:hypothetical protein BB560_000004 [Smittium megazygosporum]|uniref:Transmembrane protein 198 n=1 Tax=Smittium megazygosporum TaxID=133381 RepID=A0A2T9ZLK3_9FUNG|nr:hypothetical protein BB560_000004 [Smittium megazygosporum]